MLPKLVDNSSCTLLSLVKEIAPSYEYLSIATGYWDILGTQLVFDSIKNYEKIRLLIGREPLIPRHKQSVPEPDYPDQDFFYDLERLEPRPDLKLLVTELKRLMKSGILEVKIYRKKFFHAKSYIFGNYESQNAVGIIGSSNFTKSGLTFNTELNALESDHRVVTFRPETKQQDIGHLFWFDQFWSDANAVAWNGEFAEILSTSPVGDVLFGPYETYIKTLYELYKEELEDEKLESKFSSTHDLLDFQIKNAQALLRRLKKYKTAMLSDSVGLGKTYTAIEVIKQYLDSKEGRKRVEIICPKSLEDQWQSELMMQGIHNLGTVTLQNLEKIKKKRELDHIANVSLFVIDESHNLKNRASKRFQEIVKWIRNNPKAHILMLTATPISNQLNDMANQLLMGTGGNADILTFPYTDAKTKQTINLNFHQVIEFLQKKIKRDIKKENKIDEQHVKKIMNPIIRAFVIRRTRQGIQKEYGALKIKNKEYKFPEVEPYVKKYSYKQDTSKNIVVQTEKNQYFDAKEIYQIPVDMIINCTQNLVHPIDNIGQMEKEIGLESIEKKSPIYLMYQIILFLNFIPYKWKTYMRRYYGKSRKEIRDLHLSSEKSRGLFQQISIYGILRTMFLKRIESSVYAFDQSLLTYERKLDIFERGVRAGKIISTKNFEAIEAMLNEQDDDSGTEDLEEIDNEEVLDDKVNNNRYEVDRLLEDIKKEKAIIELLKQKVGVLKKDNAKIKSFVDLVENIEKKDSGKKVLIFSYYADTIEFLKNAILNFKSPMTDENTGFLSSKNRKEAESLACRFSPKSKNYRLKDGEREIKYLFSTDILSEGQNLQDCGIVVNYDLHWSPVRMIQRNGRINRLGTPFDKVYIYNISPEKQLEEYLRLIHRLEAKIKLIKSTIGTDTPVLAEEANPLEFTDSLKDIYSDDLQKRMEAMRSAEIESDFLLAEDEYISDLKLFHNNNPEDYKKKIYNIPLGKWGIMPKTDFRGSSQNPRPEVMALNQLFGKEDKPLGHAFLSTSKSGGSVELVQNLQALEWLRTDEQHKQRETDKISLPKLEIKKTVSRISQFYATEEELSDIEPQQREVLNIMYQNQFSEENINEVRDIFSTTNTLDKQEARKLARRIIQSYKKQKTDTASIDSLISLAQNLREEKVEPITVCKTRQALFYVKDNI